MKHKKNQLNRREALRMSAAGTILLSPIFRSFRAEAQGLTPKRLLIMFSPNGTVQDAWNPTGSEDNFTLGEILSPLNKHKSDLNILKGLQMKSNQGPGDGHQKGINWGLTNRPLLSGTFKTGAGHASGISIDQHIANAVGKNNPYKSIELGVGVDTFGNWSSISHAGSNQPISVENNPRAAFDRIFAGVSGAANNNQDNRHYEEQRSVLDFILADVNTLNKRLSGKEKAKLELHLNSIRELEKSLQKPSSNTCSIPDRPAALNYMAANNIPVAAKAQLDNIAQAFACNLTSVASIMFGRSFSQLNYGFLGSGHKNFHSMSHDDAQYRRQLIDINKWFSSQLSYFIDKLKSIPEGDGTVFDNTLILWINELGKGDPHARTNIPYVMAGSCGGHFKTGRFLQYNGDTHGKLLVSVANAMGVPISSFGIKETSNGPLSKLV